MSLERDTERAVGTRSASERTGGPSRSKDNLRQRVWDYEYLTSLGQGRDWKQAAAEADHFLWFAESLAKAHPDDFSWEDLAEREIPLNPP